MNEPLGTWRHPGTAPGDATTSWAGGSWGDQATSQRDISTLSTYHKLDALSSTGEGHLRGNPKGHSFSIA